MFILTYDIACLLLTKTETYHICEELSLLFLYTHHNFSGFLEEVFLISFLKQVYCAWTTGAGKALGVGNNGSDLHRNRDLFIIWFPVTETELQVLRAGLEISENRHLPCITKIIGIYGGKFNFQ